MRAMFFGEGCCNPTDTVKRSVLCRPDKRAFSQKRKTHGTILDLVKPWLS